MLVKPCWGLMCRMASLGPGVLEQKTLKTCRTSEPEDWPQETLVYYPSMFSSLVHHTHLMTILEPPIDLKMHVGFCILEGNWVTWRKSHTGTARTHKLQTRKSFGPTTIQFWGTFLLVPQAQCDTLMPQCLLFSFWTEGLIHQAVPIDAALLYMEFSNKDKSLKLYLFNEILICHGPGDY